MEQGLGWKRVMREEAKIAVELFEGSAMGTGWTGNQERADRLEENRRNQKT